MLSLRSLFPIALLCGLFHCQPAQALGGPDPDFVNGALVVESFDDEYAPGSEPTTSPIAIERAPGSDRFWTIYAVYGAAPGSRSLGLMRHHLDGSLDESFGVSGNPGMRLVSWPTASSDFTPAEAGMGSDGKLLVAGYVRNLDDPGLFDVVACRLLASGSFDSNFGDSGCRRLPVLSDNGTLFTIDMVPDLTGGAYISGWNQSAGRYVIQRVDSTGSIDATFGVGGVFTLFPPASEYAEIIGMAVLASGRLIIAGSTYVGGNPDWLMVRLLADGSEDASFGGNDTGYRKIVFDVGVDPTAVADKAFSVAELANGDLAICGLVQIQQMPTVAFGVGIVRLSADGVTIDPDFGTANTDYLVFSQVALSSYCYDLLALPDGGVMAAGYQTTLGGMDSDPAVLALNAQGELDARYWQGGIRVLSIDRTVDDANTGLDTFYAAHLDADRERVVMLGRSEGPELDRFQGLLHAVALHDRLFRDGLEAQ